MASPRSPAKKTAAARNGNRILAGLPVDEYRRLQPALTRVDLEQKRSLWEPDETIESVYFPVTAVASILAVTEDGGSVEVGTIGNEGFVGLPVFLGAEVSPGRAVIQVPGEAEHLDVATFRREAERDGGLRAMLHRYTQGFMTQVSQSTACNRMHSAEQRLARWLLVVADRVGGDEFSITQEFMAQMLGVRRATVTETAAVLQKKGLISYRRGVVKIEDRKAVEAASCDCYRIVRNEFERLLGVSVGG